MKKISIMMYSTLYGDSYKGRSLECIIPEILKANFLGNVFGLRLNIFSKALDKGKNIKTTVIPVVLNYFFRKIFTKEKNDYYPYLYGEKVFGYLAMKYLKKDNSDIILLKPRPLCLVKKAKEMGKYVIIEASECHPRFTQKICKEEKIKLDLKYDNIFTNEKAVSEFEESLKYADKIIVMSEYSKNTYLHNEIAESKLIKINLGVDPTFIKEKRKYNSNKKMAYICVAQHTVLKGTHLLLKVWKQLELEDAYLILVGPIKAEIKSIIEKGQVNNLICTGNLSKKNIKELFNQYNSIGVLLSFSEGYPRVITEYLYSNIPVITTEMGTCDFIENRKNGFVVNHNLNEIKEIILKLYKNEELYNKYCNNDYYRGMKEYQEDMISFIKGECEKDVKNSNS